MTHMKDKVAIVTGAGNGIGRGVALLLAQEGAKVIVNDLGTTPDGTGTDPEVAQATVRRIRETGGTALASVANVATSEGARSVVELAMNEFGTVDALVNAAGIRRDRALTKMDEAAFDAVIATHLRATFLCTQAAALAMRKSGGRIVNTTSVAGLLGNLGQANYAAAEAGVYGLTRTASIELQQHGITVNAVAPLARTRLTRDLPMFEKVESLSVEHVAPAYLFFASDLCADLTGQVLAVAGGKLSAYQLVESSGQYKETAGGHWQADEIADHWEVIAKL
jgi:NAD(P)-dependent dehydrogenase (short-subunit alcohol dehydrogenase family)